MFCDETIIAVYKGTREYDDMDTESFLDCYHELAYHVTEGERIVLETEHFYIPLDANGVSKCEKTLSIEEFEQPGEWLDNCIHHIGDDEPDWIDYEATLFIGERLLQVEKMETYYLLQFDDFELKLIPHKDYRKVPMLDSDNHSFFHVYGAERHINRKCECGGNGELLLDFVSDYAVRCKRCYKSTWAQMNAQDAIEEWNDGYTDCELDNITIR